MPKMLYNYCKYAVDGILSQFNTSTIISHAASAGAVREQIIRDFLTSHLPSACRIVSGQVFDSQDRKSTQQDLVITLSSAPRMPFASGIDLIYAEGVIATIEIKSSLTGSILSDIGNGIASVRQLQKNIPVTVKFAVTHEWSGDILSGIVAYDGSSLNNLVNELSGMPDEIIPDFILSLKNGMIISRNSKLLPPNSFTKKFIIIDDAAIGFMFFTTMLTEITGTMMARGIDWRAYWPRILIDLNATEPVAPVSPPNSSNA